MHFSRESHKFVQELQLLQTCYNFKHFLEESDKIITKFEYIHQKLLRKMRCVI